MTDKTHPNAPYLITGEERRRREMEIDYGRASVRLEGFTTSPEFEERARRYINGEIDMDEFVKPPHAPITTR